MSDGSESAAVPDEGEGSAAAGSSAPPHGKGEDDDNEPGQPEMGQTIDEVPIGIPMTEEQWRRAKKRAEQPDSDDASGDGTVETS